MHSFGIAHKNIHPGNVILVAADQLKIKITDFGFSKIAVYKFHSSKGSFLRKFTAPEMSADEKQLGEESLEKLKIDIWSIGMLLYYIIGGDACLPSVENAELKFDSFAWENVSIQYKCFLQGLIKIDPKKRCTANEAIRDRVFSQLNQC
mmetsp:Transcript_8396/g.11804  ORF Transcript_8396/g.11804 Transcript_8396/m.11804 type:complete len:149 (+) Transcript_8396:578-1024(+)